MYQKLFTRMIGCLNMGLGPEDAVVRNPLKEYQSKFGDPEGLHLKCPPQHDDRLRAGLISRAVEFYCWSGAEFVWLTATGAIGTLDPFRAALCL